MKGVSEDLSKYIDAHCNGPVAKANIFGTPSRSLAPFSPNTFHNNLKYDKMQTSP